MMKEYSPGDRAFNMINANHRLDRTKEYGPDEIYFNEVSRLAAIERLLQKRAGMGDKNAQGMVFDEIVRRSLKDLEE